MTFDEYLKERQKREDCGDPIGEEAWLDFSGRQFDVPDIRGVLKDWIRGIWAKGYQQGFRAGWHEGAETEK